jgi:UDP-N-acetylmuramoyl-L-alanyl-D-glutamate--2,6-diaminopimelate ligase
MTPRAVPAPGRRLGDLLERLESAGRLRGVWQGGRPAERAAVADLSIDGIAADSREIAPGDLFVAVPGLHVDGRGFVPEASARGARAVLVEAPVESVPIAQVVVDRGALALASAAAWWYDDPSRELAVVGVTGTNGKTTTTFLAAAALEAAGWPSGIIGTIGIRVAGEMRPNELPTTTPGALELQRLLREMALAGERAVVIEASSHGLAAERVASVDFGAAIFTNLSHEHLDFHGTFEAYRAAKLSLFERLPAHAGDGRPGAGIANLDDPAGPAFLAAARAAGALGIGYGRARDSAVRLVALEAEASSSRLEVDVAGRRIVVPLRIGGRFNAHNALAALGLALGWGLDLERVAAGLGELRGVPGRMEAVDLGQPFHVVIDYAHTPGSLEAVARELSELTAPREGGVISVFGASGERDVGKRRLMGEAAARWSRLVIVTEDDSRNEDPAAIFEAIAEGAEAAGRKRGAGLEVIPDRRRAIGEAFARARRGDVVLLAGKGHETWNIGPRGAEPWSERVTAEAALAAMGFTGPRSAAPGR